MQASPQMFNPMPGQLPGCISLAMLLRFLHRLPRPRPGEPAWYGRQMIQDALASIDAMGPRDAFEAALVMQIPTMLLMAEEVQAEARVEPDLDRRMQLERWMARLQRRVEGMNAEVRRHRKALVAGFNVQHVAPLAQSYDLDALEAVWREPERELPESALVVLPMEALMVRYGFAAAGAAGSAAAEVVAPVAVSVPPGPDGRLEDRDEFEVEPPPRFQGVPKWKQAGRKYLDELIEEERVELVEAQFRGELIEEPPQRLEEWSEP